MSLAYYRYTIRSIRRIKGSWFGGLEGLNINDANAATEARSRRAWIAYMYNDMRRIRIIMLLSFVTNKMNP